MFAVFVNVFTVLLGSTIGLLCKKGIPKRLSDAVMLGIGLCTLYIGISGTLKGENTIVLILSMVVGAIIGTLLDIDGRISRLDSGSKESLPARARKSPLPRASLPPACCSALAP